MEPDFARITKQDGVHTVQLSPDASAFVDSYSSAMTPPQQWVSKLDESAPIALNENKVAELAEYKLSPPEFMTRENA